MLAAWSARPLLTQAAYVFAQPRPEEERETSRERMRARTQLLTAISNRRKAIGEGADEATVKRLNDAVGEASRNARQAGYTPNAIQRIMSTPSDISMFSKLPEADQQAILRQANKDEFERYIGDAHMKLRGLMREERRGNAAAEKPAAPAAKAQAPMPAVPLASPPRSVPPPPPRGRSPADDLLRASPLSAR
jgi:hypothetical protein